MHLAAERREFWSRALQDDVGGFDVARTQIGFSNPDVELTRIAQDPLVGFIDLEQEPRCARPRPRVPAITARAS